MNLERASLARFELAPGCLSLRGRFALLLLCCNFRLRLLQYTQSSGSGRNPLLGEQAAEESKQAIAASLKGSDLMFITASALSATVNQQKSQNQQKELDNPSVV